MTPLLVIATANEVWRVAIQIIQKEYTTTGLLHVVRNDAEIFLATALSTSPLPATTMSRGRV
jgi:hypothetical protein